MRIDHYHEIADLEIGEPTSDTWLYHILFTFWRLCNL